MANARSDETADVAILGAGPAGCAAALTLANYTDLRVVCLDPLDGPEPPGEVLSASSTQLLEYLGLTPRDLTMMDRVRAAWGAPEMRDNASIFGLDGPGIAIHRPEFDGWLRNKATQRGVNFIQARAKNVEVSPNKCTLQTDCGSLTASYLIEASGRRSAIARCLGGPALPADDLVAIWLAEKSSSACVKNQLSIEAVKDGWCYEATLGARHIRAFVTDAATLQKYKSHEEEPLQQAFRQSRHLSGFFVPNQQARTFSATPALRTKPMGQNWVICGDAAISLDPLSSAGMSMALLTGAHAARMAAATCAGGTLDETAYGSELKRQYALHLDARNRIYRQETRWPTALFWSKWRHTSGQQNRKTKQIA